MKQNSEFAARVDRELEQIGREHLQYDAESAWVYEKEYSFIERYAYEKELFYTALALHAARAIHDGTYRGVMEGDAGEHYRIPYCKHCYDVGRLLVNLHVPFDRDEEDVLIASGILHDAVSQVLTGDRAEELVTVWHFSREILENVKITAINSFVGAEDYSYYRRLFQRIETSVTILVRLADCSSIVDRLYSDSIWKVHEYIHKTKVFYLPMCCFAKEIYPELIPVWSILMDKINTMVEATELLVERFEMREFELTSELLSLRDENATIRGFMRGNAIDRDYRNDCAD